MKKGFTLIELLSIIVILAIILLIAVPFIINTINDVKTAAYKKNELMLEKAARTYMAANSIALPINVGDSIEINLSSLLSSNLITNIKDIDDVATNCTGKVIVQKTTSSYDYYPYLSCGTNYTTTGTPAVNNLVSNISHVYNSGTSDYTITITMNHGSKTINDANRLTTPTSTIDLYKKTLLDYSIWVNGTTGSQGPYGANGTAAENQRINRTNPWGNNDLTWASLTNDVTSDADGGWSVSGLPINKDSKYRLSVWIRREDTGDGRTYMGTQANTVYNLGTTTVNANPYFRNALIADIPTMANNWLLWIAYIFPTDYAGSNDPTSGVYNLSGTKLVSNTDYKWVSNATVGGHRTYLYYSITTTEKQWWYRPRMEVVDGTEPTLTELLNGVENPDITTATNLNATGIINYTVATTGTYTFTLTRGDDTAYTFTYTVS